MSYPINQALTYTAVAQTQGTADTFNYAWAFDDSTTGNVASLSKTWTTAGVHSATVTATDTTTGGTASATKSISVADLSTFAWTSAAAKIIASTSGSVPFGNELVIVGTKLVNTHDYYSPSAATSFDTATMVRTENLSCFPSGGCATAHLLQSGPNSGKILCAIYNSNIYGFLDPSTLVFTQSSKTLPVSINYNMASICYLIEISSDSIVMFGTNSGGSPVTFLYTISSDTFTSITASPYANYLDVVKIGNHLIGIRNNSFTTDLLNINTLSWSNGPSLLGAYTYASGPFRAGYIDALRAGNINGLVVLVTGGSPNSIATWDGVSATWTQGPTYPLASVGWTSTSGCMFIQCQDGMLMDVYPYGNTVQRTKTELYQQNYFISVAWNGFGWLYRSEYCNGRAWIADNSGNLYYSTPV